MVVAMIIEQKRTSNERRMPPNPETKEENAVVLDFLQNGRPMSNIRTPLAQVMGRKHFVLLEVVPKEEVILQPYDEVYIGADKREKIHHIRAKINYGELTNTAKKIVDDIILKSVIEREAEFVEFFNKSRPVSIRLHSLELLPGIGKKHMIEILKERKIKPFESFEDLRNRVKLMPDPEKAVVKRILEELDGIDKYRLFVGN